MDPIRLSRGMISGLIETVGEIAEITPITAGMRMRILTRLGRDLSLGDSVAVNGVCLTVSWKEEADFYAEISPETARVTTLGELTPGRAINLERALRADSRIGGHFVLGHVDEVGQVDEIREEENFYMLKLCYPPSLASFIVRKGSIAVDGISLTVSGVSAQRFEVQIVPYTWQHTNLRSAKVGEPVNLECDIIGKHVVKAVKEMHEESESR